MDELRYMMLFMVKYAGSSGDSVFPETVRRTSLCCGFAVVVFSFLNAFFLFRIQNTRSTMRRMSSIAPATEPITIPAMAPALRVYGMRSSNDALLQMTGLDALQV